MTTRITARDGRVIRESGDAVEVLDPTEALLQALEMRAAAVVARAQAEGRTQQPWTVADEADAWRRAIHHPERLALSGAITETRR